MGNRCCTGHGEDRRHVETSRQRSCNLPTVSAMYGPQGWADLPDDLLHSIIPLVVSFPDLLAFAATCPSCRAAFSSYPSKSSLLTLFPPLLLQSDVPLCSPRPCPYSSNLVPRRPCYVTNLASQNMYMCCQIPLFCQFANSDGLPSPLDEFMFIGASYGQLILSNEQSCLVVDVFTGVSVSPPQVPVDEDTLVLYGTLTAPLASPNSHLMVTTRSDNFFWRIGSHSWVRSSTRDRPIKQSVVFKGQVFAMHNIRGMCIVHLVPRIHIQKIAESKSAPFFPWVWLVVCGDMLLTVGYRRCLPSTRNAFKAFCLDLSTEPAKWVKVEKLENWAIFVSTNESSQALCCMDPERWGGRSNCIYCYDSEEWITCELGKPLQGGASSPRFKCRGMMQPMWVVPSMFYSCP